MLHFTIDARSQAAIIVSDGTLKLSRLKWMGTGIRIHLMGAMTDKNRDTLNHIAMDLCVAHRIPLVSLRMMQHVRDTPAETALKDSFLRGLFDDLIVAGYEDYRYECAMCGKPCQRTDDNGHCSSCRQIWNS